MALATITLKLGKKKIELTAKEFEELKADMRQLDKNHYYYWHNYQPYWYQNSISSPITFTTSAGSAVDVIDHEIGSAPDFGGSIVSYTNN